MLQRLSFPVDEELYPGCGLWPRAELEAMNAAFVARVEAAFASGLESRRAASATVRVGSSLNGSGRRRAEEKAIELAWRWLRENMERCVDVSFAEVAAFVNARCPGVDRARIGAEIKRRFMADRAYGDAYGDARGNEDHPAPPAVETSAPMAINAAAAVTSGVKRRRRSRFRSRYVKARSMSANT